MSPCRSLISCSLLLLGLWNISGSEVTCRAPSVRRGDPGEIICDFGDDLSQATEGGVSVRKYSLDGSSTDIILLCKWINGQPACHPNKDYIFNNTISSTLVLHIPAAVGRYEGRYTCQKVPANGSETKLCEFSLQEAETEGATTTQSRGDKFVTRKEDLTEKADNDRSWDTLLVVCIVATIAGVFLVVVVVVVTMRKRLQSFYKIHGCLSRRGQRKDHRNTCEDAQESTEQML